jgi:ribosome modulation factor
MATAELHGQKISPFEQGYAAFLKGIDKKENPFNGEECPCSRKHWDLGWNKAQREAGRKV